MAARRRVRQKEIAWQEEMVTIGLTKTHSLALMARVSDWRREEGGRLSRAPVDDGVKGRQWTEG